jgi:hypothetical protein
MLELALITLFFVVYAGRKQINVNEHYNVDGFSDEERRAIVMKYYEQHPEESAAFIDAEPHIQAQMIIKIMEDVEDGMNRYPAKWWRVGSGKTVINATKNSAKMSAL